MSICSILALAVDSHLGIKTMYYNFTDLGGRTFREQSLIFKIENLMDKIEAEEGRYLITGDARSEALYDQTKERLDMSFNELTRYFPKNGQIYNEILEAGALSEQWWRHVEQHETAMHQMHDPLSDSRRVYTDFSNCKKRIMIMAAFRKKMGEINHDLNDQRMQELHHLNQMSSNLAIRNWFLVGIVIVVVGVMEDIALRRLWNLERTRDHLRESEAKLQSTVIHLREATRLKSEFISNVSHEIRTPLNAILGFVQVLQNGTYGPLNEKQKDRLTYVHAGGRHLLSLINDILDLSKAESGKMDLENSSFSIHDLLQNSIDIFEEKARISSIDLVLEPGGNMDPITADKRKIQQIVFNLLSNALKFTPAGGRITVGTRVIDGNGKTSDFPFKSGLDQWELPLDGKIPPDKRFLLIFVRDTGIGIPPSELKNVFEPFRQVDGSHIRNFQGSGLGLSLVKRLAEIHGGTAWAESDGEGKGAAFFFTLPLESQENSSNKQKDS